MPAEQNKTIAVKSAGPGTSSHGRTKAILQALLVTLLWSSSWIIIKLGLGDVPPLTLAGLRFFLAFLCLLPFARRQLRSGQLKAAGRNLWLEILGLGVLYYAIIPGGQNLGLKLLPANTLSLIISFSAVLVALLGAAFLREKPSWLQWAGMALSLLGVVVYFRAAGQVSFSTAGLAAGLVTMTANAFASIMGRKLNHGGAISPLLLTVLSMAVGAVLILGVGLAMEGLPHLTTLQWLLILWLAVVNTAFAYQLWNKTLVELPALESVLINNTMLAQIAILAWVFLGEKLTALQVIGLVASLVGVVVVQLRGRQTRTDSNTES
jgi:drug/metabolite transporter (DMT)-like permease